MSLTKPIDEFKREFREKLIQEDLAETLQALLANLPEGADSHQKVVLLLGDLNKLNADSLEGVITTEALRVGYNQIRSALLKLIEGLEESDFDPNAVSKAAETPPAEKEPVQGNVLYRIPHSMPLAQETKCVVRVAVQKRAIVGNIQLDEHIKVEGLARISELMQAELIDPAANPNFSIRTTSEPEQLVHPEGYTEWFFFVTPLHPGIHELEVKISVIELVFGKERKKEIALTRSVEVVADGVPEQAEEGELQAAGIQFGLPNKAAAAAAMALMIRPKKGATDASSSKSTWNSLGLRIVAAVAAVVAIALTIWSLSDKPDSPGVSNDTSAAPGVSNDTSAALAPPSTTDLPADSSSKQPPADSSAAAAPAVPEPEQPVTSVTPATPVPNTDAPPRTAAPASPVTSVAGMEHPDMILVRGGTFVLGDAVGDNDRSDNPRCSVSLVDYYLSAKEVTFEEYDRYCQATRAAKPRDQGWGRGSRPVVNVTWFEAVRYCNWLSKQLGYQPVYSIRGQVVEANWNANGFRLPTEAEWEYAARGGGKTVRFGNGKNTADPRELNFDANPNYKERYSAPGENRKKTMPVASFKPNPLGLYDMAGNVREWCWDWYALDYYMSSPGSNPRGPEKGDLDNRVVRGGSWSNAPQSTRAAFRDDNAPDIPESNIGFRLARNAR